MPQSAYAPSMPQWHRFVFRRYASPISEAKPDLLLYALTLMILTYVWRVQDLFAPLGAVKISLIAMALSIGLFAIGHHPARHIGHLGTPILFCGLALLWLAVLGIPTSLWPRRTFISLISEFAPNVLLMVLLAASIRGMRDLEWIALVNVLGACLFCAFVYLKFDIGPSGRLGDLVYYDANDLALVLVCTIPFSIFFALRRGWSWRLLGLASLVLFVATFVRSGSRGGFLGFVAVMAYVLLGYRAIPKRVRLLSAAGGIAVLSLVASDAYWATIRTLGSPREDYNWSGKSTAGRVELWKRGVGYMAANPVLGVGLRNFPLAEGHSPESKARAERGAGFKWSVAHNSFVEVGAELGVLALALFVWMLISAFRMLRRIRSVRASKDDATMREVALSYALSTSLVGFIVSGFFVSAWYFSYVFMLLGLVMGFSKVDRFLKTRSPAWAGHSNLQRRRVIPETRSLGLTSPSVGNLGTRPFRDRSTGPKRR